MRDCRDAIEKQRQQKKAGKERVGHQRGQVGAFQMRLAGEFGQLEQKRQKLIIAAIPMLI